MIAAAVNRAHVGRKAKIGSLDGLIVDVNHRIRGGFTNRRRRHAVDIHFHLDTQMGLKHIIVSPRTEVQILPPVLPTQWRR